ncbi:hypothetical protein [Roseimaritima ulvae]|uniref:Uncharacterized protein n=1 Tax=Roseimaritima ulvae TaxID=980254 RepID=A0A5B9QTK2_9BACT|nr:hypothetical protein [Roseimaritima ulvae]QEG41242.1 hypothetical protein UC8_32610 [Roseimaritima ulvae]
MTHLITFQTDKFDPRGESENPYNPIAGEGVLNWLRTRLAPAIALSKPEPEDFGWCCSVTVDECVYFVVASADLDQESPIEWALQIDKRRSLMDKLRGRNQHGPDDPLTAAIKSAIDTEQEFREISIDTATR